MKRFLLLASLAMVAAAGVAAIPAEAGAAKVKCKGKEKAGKRIVVKCPRNKLRGPRGPIGPVGPTPSPPAVDPDGRAKIFFAANGVAPNTTIFSGGGLNIQAACTGGQLSNLEFRTTKDHARFNVLTGNADTGATNASDEDDFALSDVLSAGGADLIMQWVYTAPDQTVVTGVLAAEDDEGSSFNGTIDCLVAGSAEVA